MEERGDIMDRYTWNIEYLKNGVVYHDSCSCDTNNPLDQDAIFSIDEKDNLLDQDAIFSIDEKDNLLDQDAIYYYNIDEKIEKEVY